MAVLSQKSKDKLSTCHPDIQKVILEAVKQFDFTVLYGTRTVDEQFELYKQGRTLSNGVWVKTGRTVTELDGKVKKSKHNSTPSLAVDLAPYPIDWNNIQRFKDMAKVVLACAKNLGVDLVWGADWDSDGDIEEHKFKDYPHFQLGK